MSGRCQNIADSSCLDILQYSSDHNNSNLASESLGIRLLELWHKPNYKPNQMAANKHGGMMEKKSHHVETSFELMVLVTFIW